MVFYFNFVNKKYNNLQAKLIIYSTKLKEEKLNNIILTKKVEELIE
jgi:hypothetical protein